VGNRAGRAFAGRTALNLFWDIAMPISAFKIYRKILDVFSWLTIGFCGAALTTIIVVTGWQVYGRYVLNDPPTWAENLALLLLLCIAFPAAAVGIRERFHLGIVFFMEKANPKVRRFFDLFTNLVLLGFGVAMVIGGWDVTAKTWSIMDSMLPVTRGTYYLPIFISGILMVLFCIEHVIEFFTCAENDSCKVTQTEAEQLGAEND
jgi:TRAP-type C4-dicarboxylate transport system permease small subunit